MTFDFDENINEAWLKSAVLSGVFVTKRVKVIWKLCFGGWDWLMLMHLPHKQRSSCPWASVWDFHKCHHHYLIIPGKFLSLNYKSFFFLLIQMTFSLQFSILRLVFISQCDLMSVTRGRGGGYRGQVESRNCNEFSPQKPILVEPQQMVPNWGEGIWVERQGDQ